MRTPVIAVGPAVSLIALLLCAGVIHAEVRDVKVTIDRSIDCSSMTTIARDLYRNCKTDEAKAIGQLSRFCG